MISIDEFESRIEDDQRKQYFNNSGGFEGIEPISEYVGVNVTSEEAEHNETTSPVLQFQS